jgi:GH15 family glucan-1,4-alpha-glucosidase
MKIKSILTISLLLFCLPFLYAQKLDKPIEPSYFKLTTSNGLIVAVYDTKKASIEYVFPHIFANYDSALFVHPFVGNIKLNIDKHPTEASYLKNTHVITASYNDFTINYFSSFTNSDKIFYVVIKGEKEKIENLSFSAETGNGNLLTGVSLLTYSHEDLTVHLAGNTYTGSMLRRYDNNIYEKYFLYSFTDSLHTDTAIVSKAIARLTEAKKSLLDDEVHYLQKLFSTCNVPKNLSPKERNVVEQSISFLKMAQVSDKEIFPYSHGQILASLRPGLWHVAWVRDGSYAIQAMTRLGMYEEAKEGLEFMLKAPSGRYKNYIHKDGKDYGVGSDYQISVCRYFGNGNEESTNYGNGPNIEFDNFGLFLSAFCDYIESSGDTDFYKKWNDVITTKVADVTISIMDTNSLIREDSGPWEHYLEMPRQYTFTSGVCARGLEQFAMLQKQFNLPYEKYKSAAETLRQGILTLMLIENRYIKGNVNDRLKTDHEYYDAGVFEIFANSLVNDKKLFLSHMEEYDKVLRLKGERPGYIRLSSADPYENQEWVFINLRIALAHLLFGQKNEAAKLLNHVTEQAAANYNTIPEMYSNKVQSDKVTEYFMSHDVWCNCIRDKDDLYIGAIPMVGYGSGAYILTLFAFYKE